jgi:hypothetical protein
LRNRRRYDLVDSNCPKAHYRLEQFVVSQQNPAPRSEIGLCHAEDDRTHLEVKLLDNIVWLTQTIIAELFQVAVPTVTRENSDQHAETL